MITGMAEVPRCSPGQLGAVREAFRRIGVGDDERRWRLHATSELLGIPAVGSTRDLDTIQAGKLIRILAQFTTEAELAAAVAAVKRQKQRERFLLQPAAALACHGDGPLVMTSPARGGAAGTRAWPGSSAAAWHWLATRSSRVEEVPDGLGQHAAR
jgi:hypothetical protein